MKKFGVIISTPKYSDYVSGTPSEIFDKRKILDWGQYLPVIEKQHSNTDDFMICTTMSGPDHSIASQLNYLFKNNLMTDEAINFFRNNGYIVNENFSLSSRYNATLNGTNKLKGQSLNGAAENVRKYGIIPEKDWPTTDTMTWKEFYKTIPNDLVLKGIQSLWFLKIQYQWVLKDKLKEKLLMAPIQIATEVCSGWGEDKPIPKCSNQPIQHATLLFGIDNTSNWFILDHYAPFKKILEENYELPINLQYIVSMKPLCLRNGMNGKNVLQLQKDLNKIGYMLKEDGSFGPKTEKAVKDFQLNINLEVDGLAGQKTLEKLNMILNENSNNN